HNGMNAFRHQRDKVPEGVVRRSSLGHSVMGLRFYGMHQIRKLHRILNKKHRYVIANQIPVALVCIEFHGKTPNVPRGVLGAALTGYSGKTHKYRRAFARLSKNGGTGNFRKRLVALKIAMCSRTSGMNNTFRNTLMVKVRDFFTQNKVLEQHRSTQPCLE